MPVVRKKIVRAEKDLMMDWGSRMPPSVKALRQRE
jgi:hypothetical protein